MKNIIVIALLLALATPALAGRGPINGTGNGNPQSVCIANCAVPDSSGAPVSFSRGSSSRPFTKAQMCSMGIFIEETCPALRNLNDIISELVIKI